MIYPVLNVCSWVMTKNNYLRIVKIGVDFKTLGETLHVFVCYLKRKDIFANTF